MTTSSIDVEIPYGDGETTVSGLALRPRGAEAALVLAHGAGANMRHPFMTEIAELLAAEGVATLRYNFPYMEDGRKAPDRPVKLIAALRGAVDVARRRFKGLPLFIGGKSLGGRMSSTAAADGGLDGILGIVFLGFPLHSPAKPGNERAAHLIDVPMPMLFLQGTRDKLAKLELLQPVCDELGKRATLHIIDGADHGFAVPKKSGRSPEDVRRELAQTATEWMREHVA